MNRFLQTENTLSIFTNWVEDTISIGKIDSFDGKYNFFLKRLLTISNDYKFPEPSYE